MKILRLYSDREGETHFEELDIPLKPNGRSSWHHSRRLPGNGLVLGESPLQHEVDWERAPLRQYAVNLDTPVEITASDGETRLVESGDIVLMEDTTGKGHISRAWVRRPRHFLFIPVK